MSHRPPETLQRLWLLQLHDAWVALNDLHLGGRLRPPQFALDFRANPLGLWEPRTRTVRISVPHLMLDTWAAVELTLRHEMAHQVVAELWGAPGASPHGALFERASRLLDLTHSPRLPREPDPASVRTLERVRKLLNLAQSPNAHEAQLAMAAANRLLLKHNLSRADVEGREAGYHFRWLGEPLSRLPLERKLLAGLLQRHFFVRTIWLSTHRARDTRPVSQLEVLGEPHNLDIAEYVHDYLLATVDRLWEGYLQTLPVGAGRSARQSYRVGVVMGFCEHLDAQAKTDSHDGLIWLGDAVLDELFEARHPRRTTVGGGTYVLGQAHDAGREDGRQIRLRPGLGEAPAERGRLLPS
jgi:hypothetical protein